MNEYEVETLKKIKIESRILDDGSFVFKAELKSEDVNKLKAGIACEQETSIMQYDLKTALDQAALYCHIVNYLNESKIVSELLRRVTWVVTLAGDVGAELNEHKTMGFIGELMSKLKKDS